MPEKHEKKTSIGLSTLDVVISFSEKDTLKFSAKSKYFQRSGNHNLGKTHAIQSASFSCENLSKRLVNTYQLYSNFKSYNGNDIQICASRHVVMLHDGIVSQEQFSNPNYFSLS